MGRNEQISMDNYFRGFVLLLLKIYCKQDPSRLRYTILFLFAMQLVNNEGVVACDRSEERLSCNIDNGDSHLLEQAIVEQDDNITFEAGETVTACFAINTTLIQPNIKTFDYDCVVPELLKTLSYQGNITTLCVNFDDVQSDHKLLVQLVSILDVSVSCFKPVYIRGIPDEITLLGLKTDCNKIVTSFEWPPGATKVNIAVYDDYGALVHSADVPASNSTVVDHNIPRSILPSPGTYHIQHLALNSAGSARNSSSTSIFIPQDKSIFKFRGPEVYLVYLNSTLYVIVTMEVNSSCYTDKVHLETNCSSEPNKRLPLVWNDPLNDNVTTLEIPVDEHYLQPDKKNCLLNFYYQEDRIHQISGLDTSDIKIFSCEVIDNALNCTCIFVENSPATACGVIVNGQKYGINVSSLIPLRDQHIQGVVQYVKGDRYINYTSFEININVTNYNDSNNTTEKNDTCMCEKTDDETEYCDCHSDDWKKQYFAIIIVAALLVIFIAAAVSIIAGIFICWYHFFHSHSRSDEEHTGNGDSEEIMLKQVTVTRAAETPENSTIQESSQTEYKPLLNSRNKEQVTREGEAGKAHNVPSSDGDSKHNVVNGTQALAALYVPLEYNQQNLPVNEFAFSKSTDTNKPHDDYALESCQASNDNIGELVQ